MSRSKIANSTDAVPALLETPVDAQVPKDFSQFRLPVIWHVAGLDGAAELQQDKVGKIPEPLECNRS